MGVNRMDQKIDFIVYWVDGNDPKWREKKNKYAVAAGQDASDKRYRDWDNLQYLFRGIEKFAPWVNRVFFVTDGQIPQWMNTDNPKLKIVDHRDYMPEEYIPTFSSIPIELNFFRIGELSEQFVVFNDDFFLTAPVAEEDFFRSGKPVDIFMEYPVMCGGNVPVFSHQLVNNFNVIGKYFERGAYKKRLRNKILTLKYGSYCIYNLIMYLLPFPRFFGMLTPHFCRPYLKSSFFKVWELEGELLDRVSRNRFRTTADVNIYLFRLYNMMEGNFEPGNIFKMGHAYMISDSCEDACEAIQNQKHKMICINDECDDAGFEEIKDRVNRSFQRILPEKSSFEK